MEQSHPAINSLKAVPRRSPCLQLATNPLKAAAKRPAAVKLRPCAAQPSTPPPQAESWGDTPSPPLFLVQETLVTSSPANNFADEFAEGSKQTACLVTFASQSGRKPARPRAFLAEPALYDHAVKALGRRMRTESELRRLLAARAEPGPTGQAAVHAVLARLKENHYLDDKSYAEAYARLRQENEKFGRRRVQQDLKQKGLATHLIDETLDARYANTSEEALARQFLERKRLRKPANDKETARILRRLVAAGFSTSVIYKILRQWDVPDESLAALENISDNPADDTAASDS